jgi:hypothetical protein
MAHLRDRAAVAADVPTAPIGWRTLEGAIVDALRRQGCRFYDQAGRTFVVVEFCDETTGELLQRKFPIDIEMLARDLADVIFP